MKSERIHPATRTFQALRIYVNAELSEIDALLRLAPEVLEAGRKAGGDQLHSLEDTAREGCAARGSAGRGFMMVLTRKPLTAEAEETDRNPRARSAKLRAAERRAGEARRG